VALLDPGARSSEAEHVASVQRYYDANTSRFVRFGQGKGSIHRAVWGPGATTLEQALHWVDERVCEEVGRVPSEPKVLDLGCGVGASLHYIAERTRASGLGVTVSKAQAERATELIESAGLAARLRVVAGDFHALEPEISGFDVAFAIESFVHGTSPERFFASTARALRAGGRLLLCDDVLERSELSPADARRVAAFREGWRARSLCTVPEIEQSARLAGFTLTDNVDLTPYLELGRPRDVAIGVLVRVAALLGLDGPYLGSLRGGDALQRAMRSGALAYRLLTFETAR
jgi:cyclopropane fatty-acyl-phospholipid synthase-like methyltransferase